MISQVPNEKVLNLQLSTLATDDIGDTPSSPYFVYATPIAAKNSPKTNKIYLFSISVLLILVPP